MTACARRLARLLASVLLGAPLAGCGQIGVTLLPAPEQEAAGDPGSGAITQAGSTSSGSAERCMDLEADGGEGALCDAMASGCAFVDTAQPCEPSTPQDDDGDPCPLDDPDDSDDDGTCDSDDRCPGYDDALDDDGDGVPDDCDLPSCGDGELQPELGETCDTSSGNHPCPAQCDDGKACTRDVRRGDPDACNVSCDHSPITTMTDGDGCCPEGGDASRDRDCPAVCGNGIIEPGEACDGGEHCTDCRGPHPGSLVHRYDFEGEGTTAFDRAGTAHGRCVNTAVRDGRVDLARNIDNNYVELPAGILSALSQVSIEVWLQWDGGEAGQHIFDFGNSEGGHGTSFFYLDPRSFAGRLTATLNLTPTANDIAANWSVTDNGPLDQLAVHHVAVTFDGSTLALYLDGRLRDTSTRTGGALSQLDDHHNWLGRSQEAFATELDAILYEFRIYDRALTAEEIHASYLAGTDPDQGP